MRREVVGGFASRDCLEVAFPGLLPAMFPAGIDVEDVGVWAVAAVGDGARVKPRRVVGHRVVARQRRYREDVRRGWRAVAQRDHCRSPHHEVGVEAVLAADGDQRREVRPHRRRADEKRGVRRGPAREFVAGPDVWRRGVLGFKRHECPAVVLPAPLRREKRH